MLSIWTRLKCIHLVESLMNLLMKNRNKEMYWKTNLSLLVVLTHYQTTNLDSSKLKDFAGDNLKFQGNGRTLFKPVENTVGKGEIACYEQFLLFPQCFQKACFQGASKGVIVW